MKKHFNPISCIPFLFPLLIITYSCKKEVNPEIRFNVQFQEITYYPEKNIFLKFSVIPEGSFKPLTLVWHEPSGLQGNGPFSMNISKNLLLDFDIQDANQNSERFTYVINPDTIDSVKYDYRNHYTGQYNCKVTHYYNGSYSYSSDTIAVEKDLEFIGLNVIAGNVNYHMWYLYPENFFGYHSGLYFSGDSIHYTVSGPLGYYYTNKYEGIRITP